MAKAAGARVVGTGRSDFPNQVNNVVAFPGIFKGALEGRATQITDNVYGKIAAAALTTEDTAPSVQGAVPIGTGHPGIQGYFIAFMVKRIFTIGIQRVVGLAVPVSDRDIRPH